jgi:hypothetical protein
MRSNGDAMVALLPDELFSVCGFNCIVVNVLRLTLISVAMLLM